MYFSPFRHGKLNSANNDLSYVPRESSSVLRSINKQTNREILCTMYRLSGDIYQLHISTDKGDGRSNNVSVFAIKSITMGHLFGS